MTLSGTLLITGDTGTFGHAILRRFLATEVGDVCQPESVRDAIARRGYIFCAVARSCIREAA